MDMGSPDPDAFRKDYIKDCDYSDVSDVLSRRGKNNSQFLRLRTESVVHIWDAR